MIQQLQTRIQQLKGSNQQLEAQVMATPMTGNSGYKLPPPASDNGKDGNVQGFLTQAKAYLRFYARQINTEPDKVLCVAGFLKGEALEWFEPTMRNYLDKNEEEREDETNNVFQSYHHFKGKLRTTFGNPDKARLAERRLMTLQQRGSASKYAAEFKQIASRTDWTDEDALMAQFYTGLRDDIKDKVSKTQRPDELDDYVTQVIKINNRLYEQQAEKQSSGVRTFIKPNIGKQRYNNRNYTPRVPSTATGYHSGPMDLDATKHDKKDVKCYNCGRNEHYKKECRSSPRNNNQWRKVPEPQRQTAATTRSGYIKEREVSMMARVNTSQEPHISEKEYRCHHDQEGRACPAHPYSAKSQEAIRKGCHCYTTVIYELHPYGWTDSEDKDSDEDTLTFDDNGRPELPEITPENYHRFKDDIRIVTQGRSRPEVHVTTTASKSSATTQEFNAQHFQELNLKLFEQMTAQKQSEKLQEKRGLQTDGWIAVPGRRVEEDKKVIDYIQTYVDKPPKVNTQKEDTRLIPKGLGHKELSWISCILNDCGLHLREKLHYQWFPTRTG
ncbi:Uu.00g107750.m01.CDS01 [Anthostomella pinea]|uniref:Uu.00g107750.m01.CDS01 n=1 Tax=Anthostomella pinea TaxID=933095 RepID=A0AAI8VE94_9PEZI|nr:Uu.00g107750.m01.CDS01 [Anthostomella pinea]